VALALVVLSPADEEVDAQARGHAETACELTSKAAEAAGVESAARLAAAALLLDRAIIESARAAEGGAEYADLDQAVQAVHTAAHSGVHQRWVEALDAALASCQDSVG
jgi:hypothetical protein